MKRAHLKGQSAMEYLMTYGWAILIVIIVAAVLFSLGVFDPGAYVTTSSVGFPGFNVPANSYALDATDGVNNGILTFKLTNGVGANVNVQTVSVASVTGLSGVYDCDADAGVPIALNPGETVQIVCNTGATPIAGGQYSARVELTYDNVDGGWTGIESAGTLTGTVI